MARLTLAILAVACAVAFSDAAWSQCPGHDNMTVKNDTPQTVLDSTTTLPPSAPTSTSETKTGG